MVLTTIAEAASSCTFCVTCSKIRLTLCYVISFGQKSCCLPHGGQSSPPSPPTGTQCPPSGWYWHTGKGCCVPDHPPTQQPPPQCNNGWDWDDNNLKCCPHSTPTPSPPKPSSHHRKRVLKTRNTSICPKGKEACPIPGTNGLTSESECLDTEVDLTSCGGCASTGVGQDCTAIPGAWNVGCSRGSCQSKLGLTSCFPLIRVLINIFQSTPVHRDTSDLWMAALAPSSKSSMPFMQYEINVTRNTSEYDEVLSVPFASPSSNHSFILDVGITWILSRFLTDPSKTVVCLTCIQVSDFLRFLLTFLPYYTPSVVWSSVDAIGSASRIWLFNLTSICARYLCGQCGSALPLHVGSSP